MGSVHHLGNLIPNLSQLCFPLRPLLKKKQDIFGQMNMRNNSN